jgi:DNA repair protein RadC
MDTAEILKALKLSRLPSDLLSPETWDGLNARESRILRAAVELGRRALSQVPQTRPRFMHACIAASYIAPRLLGLQHEEFWVIFLDARLGLRGAKQIPKGGLTACAVSPREVFREALLDGAAAIMTVHNHPSGDPTPSGEDARLFMLVDEGAEALGIRSVDHLIIGSDTFHSQVEGRGKLALRAA